MENFIEILKKEFNFEDLNEFESITDIVKENNFEGLFNNDITEILIDRIYYYIINITCDYCGESYYYIADTNDNIINAIKSCYEFEATNNFDTVCQNCIDNGDFYHCDQCGELIHADDSIWCEDDSCLYCEDCADEQTFVCDDCGERHSINGRYITGDNQEICENCCQNSYCYCEGCGELYHYSQLHYDENSQADYCDSCFEDSCCSFDYNNAQNRDNDNIPKLLKDYDDVNAICEYHHNPIDFVKRKSLKDDENEKLFFGVELEISTDDSSYLNEASSFVADNLYCRLEHDSSIPNYGFEIISDPMTLQKWTERKNKINQVFNELINNGFVSHNARGGNCGLHIHASKEALGDTEVEQEETTNNIILITENFKKELQKFSRRKDFAWCHFFNDDTEENKETNINKIKEEKGKKGRYQVINTTNRHTIELRINRGTLKTNTFFASLQLFYNIIQLAKTKNFISKSWDYLIKMNNFEELQNYVNEREIKSNTKIIETSKKEAEKEKTQKNKYNTIIILKDNIHTETEINNIINTLEKENIIKIEKQGTKQLAYEINGEKQGYYLTITHYSNFEKIKDFELYLNSKNNILKYLSFLEEVI